LNNLRANSREIPFLCRLQRGMQKKFITNLILLLVLNLLIKPFWILGIDRAVQNAVSPGDYGLYYALFNFSFLFNILLDFGVTNFNNKNIAQHQHLLSKHVPSIIMLRIMLGCLYFVGTILSAFVLGYGGYQIMLVALLGLNQFLASFILYLRSNLAGLHLFKTDSIISVLDRLIMILFCSILLWGGIRGAETPFRIEWYIYCQTAAYFVTCLVALVLVLDKAGMKKLSWNPAFFLVILKKSYPYGILVLLMTFYNRIDAVMLERMLPDGKIQSSIYASAYRLLDAANMIAYLFAGLLLPLFARMLKLREKIEDLVKLSVSLLMVLSLGSAIATWFFAKEITQLLYAHHVTESAQVLSLLMACFVFVSLTYVFGTLLTANGNLRELNLMAGAGMLLNIGLNIILIPNYKALGSAMSSLITQSLMALIQIYIAYRKFNFRINYGLFIKISTFAISLFLVGWILKTFWVSNWIQQFAIFCSCALICTLLTGLIKPRALLRTIRSTQEN
jgi:O-antigen/teichoic acid export membrane protein